MMLRPNASVLAVRSLEEADDAVLFDARDGAPGCRAAFRFELADTESNSFNLKT